MTRLRSFGVSTTIAAILVFGQSGCMNFLNPVEPLSPAQVGACQELPQTCRSKVYVFFVNGMDPLDCANLCGVRDYLQSLGFIKAYYGQMYHTLYFAHEIRRLHKCEPDARFALVGFSFGANFVRDIANAVRADNIPIDLLVYLGGNTLTNAEIDRPANAARIVNILATGYVWNGATLTDAENLSYGDVWHFGSPTYPKTVEVLVHELMGVAAHIPVIEYNRPAVSESRDEWDFLLPGAPVPELPPMPQPRARGVSQK